MDESEQAAENSHLRRLLEEAKQSANDARRAVGLLNSIIDLLPVGVTVQSEDGAVVLENALSAKLHGAQDGAGAAACRGAHSRSVARVDE